ncbi:MAG: succinate dehydrogenase assembly factor 2 [Methylotenera sp.]|nr:succinate dehydrogenase assembly factor 2 [Methylotenera sp.]
MSDTENMTDEEVRRLSWRCRRGLLELDIILQRFSENHLTDLSTQELLAFDYLLDLPDNEFLDVVTARKALTSIKVSSNKQLDAVVIEKVAAKLRQS